jgi:hypothetical protein
MRCIISSSCKYYGQVKVSSPNDKNQNEVENDSDEMFPDKDST